MKTVRPGILKRIHINGALLREAKRGKKAVKPISIQNHDGLRVASKVDIKGPSTLVFSPDKRLSSGAVLWIETRSEVDYE